jgi:hypothetical protein
LPLRLSRPQWREALRWFVRDATSADIARETGIERKRVLRALMIVRQALLRAAQYGVPTPAPRPTQVVLIGLRVSHDRASAEVLPPIEAEQLARWLRKRENGHAHVPRHSRRYMAVVYRGRLHRLAERGAERVPFGPIEAFWAHVQRQLRAKGGIRRERLDLYLASFAWRYNHRKVPPAEQVRELLGLVGRSRSVSRSGLSRSRRKT